MRQRGKILVAATVAIAVVLAIAFFVTPRPGEPEEQLVDNRYCGSGVANSNQYVREHLIPIPCSQPLGITIDPQGNIWLALLGEGRIARFNPVDNIFTDFKIPFAEDEETQIWGMSLDRSGKLWFTDMASNAIWRFDPSAKNFEKFLIPTEDSFPVQIYIDQDQTVWFTEALGNKLGKINPSQVKAGTSDGIEELTPPEKLETLGGLAGDSKGRIWFTMLTFPFAGKAGYYDTAANSFRIFNLPPQIRSPVGIVFDPSGRALILDHGSGFFALFDPANNITNVYTTSTSTTKLPVSLPYWAYTDQKGRIWFNQHQSNRISYFDPASNQLVEYDVPTANPEWGGIANALQLAVAPDGKIWFTEWTENKIGVINPNIPVPFDVSLHQQAVRIAQGNSIQLGVTISKQDQSIEPETRVAGTFSITGRLVNMTASFEPSQALSGDTRTEYQLRLTAPETVQEGNYTLMIGASYGGVTRLVPLDVTVDKD
ncbi:MAG: SMP-30/gluconolactonase/LRE family protein [Thaumarchaeota archaeon]|nr:SMP-30/gluconolactonase/LRE family protein [Nitrososphaerota archaeon]